MRVQWTFALTTAAAPNHPPRTRRGTATAAGTDMTDDSAVISRALLSVSDKTGLVEFARALADARRRAGLDRRHPQGARRCRAHGARRVRADRLSRDDGRPGEDAASRRARRPAGDPRQQGACRGDAGARHPADRSAGGQSLSVRGDGREGRRLRDLHREHRHRRPGDDPRRRQEPRRRRRGGRRRRLCGGAGGAQGERRRDHAGAAPEARRQGLCAHRRL